MRATFIVSIFIQKTKLKANGKATILGRVIVNGNMLHFSTHQAGLPEDWISTANRKVGKTAEERTINGNSDYSGR